MSEFNIVPMTTDEKASLALKHRLYVSGWELSHQLVCARKYPQGYEIKLEYVGEVPVGVCLLDKDDGCISIFVKKAFRRKGIGRKLVKRFGDKIKKADWGIHGSEYFFDNVGIEMGRY